MNPNKIFIIGIDGATFDIINPLVKNGKLPTFSKLIKEGVHGKLESTIPPSSIPAWQSFMTGTNPGKHGVFDFMKRRNKNDYYGTLTTSNDIKEKTLWKYISNSGKKSVVINITGTYPPEKINGIIISGSIDTPSGVVYTYPPDISKQLDKKKYIKFIDLGELNSENISQKLLKMETTREEISKIFMKNYDWDLFMVMFIGADTIQHKLWSDLEKIYDFYVKIDELIGDLLKEIGNNTNIFIMSDHGFGELTKFIHINKWLCNLGLLKYKKVGAESTRIYKLSELERKKLKSLMNKLFTKFGITRENLNIFFKKVGLKRLKNYLPSFIKNTINSNISKIPQTNVAIDWRNTKVFLSSFFGTETQSIMINLKEREPEGTVSQEEYEKLRNLVIKKLKELKDPETNELVVEKVFKREELYHGSYVKEGPDIIMLLKGKYKASNSLKAEKVITKLNKIQGSHRLHGIFIAHGPDIEPGKKVENARITDLAPTILHILNIPIPSNMDGKILREIFKKNSKLTRKETTYKINTERNIISNKIKELKNVSKL